MTLILSGDITLRRTWQPMDPDAAAYITAVETADGQALEEPVKIAIDNFVLGCKADGIWSAIKASCILAGARTLNGALVPLVGAAPTNFNFVSGDYNRKTGLVGNGSTKYLDSNRNNNADPQNNRHLAAYATLLPNVVGMFLATRPGAGSEIGGSRIEASSNGTPNYQLSIGINSTSQIGSAAAGFYGCSRNSSSSVFGRSNGQTGSASQVSTTPLNNNLGVFARRELGGTVNAYTNARIAFYSIGESLDLAKLDARVTDLINKFAEVIP